MKTTLTLDDDVADLLELVRREQGRTPEEIGNDLLRSTLTHLGIASAPRAETARSPVDVSSGREASSEALIQPFASGRCLLDKLESISEALAQTEGEWFK